MRMAPFGGEAPWEAHPQAVDRPTPSARALYAAWMSVSAEQRADERPQGPRGPREPKAPSEPPDDEEERELLATQLVELQQEFLPPEKHENPQHLATLPAKRLRRKIEMTLARANRTAGAGFEMALYGAALRLVESGARWGTGGRINLSEPYSLSTNAVQNPAAKKALRQLSLLSGISATLANPWAALVTVALTAGVQVGAANASQQTSAQPPLAVQPLVPAPSGGPTGRASGESDPPRAPEEDVSPAISRQRAEIAAARQRLADRRAARQVRS